MKIFNNNIDKIVQAYKRQDAKKGVKEAGRLTKKDQLSLSEKAKEYQAAMNALKDTPDVRTEKVEAIKHQIETGTYKVDASKIAQKMLDNINMDKRI
ncbi:flagellar biosynthesis anti-sigma factor FlgM [Brassicibacter mesophilus]|uniref:flagellar biosynthesis anti-sigma factor FlgM n=1 Tax=Brassicibacter mesophilus TaxID=745119 RepID=UPI003D20AA46